MTKYCTIYAKGAQTMQFEDSSTKCLHKVVYIQDAKNTKNFGKTLTNHIYIYHDNEYRI